MVPTPISILNRNRVEVALGRRLTEQEALVQLSQMALEIGDPLAVMQEAVERVAAIQEVEVVAVLEQISSDETVMRALFDAADADGVGKHYSLHPGTPAGFAIASKIPVLVDDLSRDPRFKDAIPLRERGMVSGMTVIIPSRGGVWGARGEFSQVVVMDDGGGIPVEDRARIFQPYERAHQRHGQPACSPWNYPPRKEVQGPESRVQSRTQTTGFARDSRLGTRDSEKSDHVAVLVDVDL